MSPRILYHEETGTSDGDQAIVAELRLWSDGDYYDLVLETHVIVDGTPEISASHSLPPTLTDAQAIRHAIRAFDDLVDDHPWSGPLGSDSQEAL